MTVRKPLTWHEVERDLRPSTTKLLTAEVKQLSLRRMGPALGLQSYLCQAFTGYHPGDVVDKSWVLQQIRSPGD